MEHLSIIIFRRLQRNKIARLTREEVVKLHNCGCGKTIERIWEEEDLKALGANMMKSLNIDTGGTDGGIPEALLDRVREQRKLSLTDHGRSQYQWEDARMKAVRLIIIKREACRRVKNDAGTFDDYVSELVRMTNQTLDDSRKRADRRKLAATVT